MLPVEWRPRARQSLWAILDYLGDRNPYAAEAVVHPNYLVIYRVASDHIAIVDVLHARQEYP